MENLVRLVTISKELGLRLRAASLLPAGFLALAVLGLIASGAASSTPDLERLVVSVTNLGAGDGFLLLLGLLLYFVIVSVALEPASCLTWLATMLPNVCWFWVIM